MRYSLAAILLILLAPLCGPLYGQGQTRLEIASDKQAPVTAMQEWMRALGAAGVTDVRVRVQTLADKPGVETQGTDASRVYVVTGLIDGSGNLILPGGRYRPSEAARAAKWLKELAELGPVEKREKKTAFGLTVSQFAAIHEALAPTVGFSTLGQSRAEVIQKVASKALLPVRLAPELLKAAKGDEEDKVAEELSEVACGTALACLVRPLGWCLVPRATAGGSELIAVPVKAGTDIWPVGWPPDQPAPKAFPMLFESFNANISNVPVATVLDAVSKRTKMPILLDHNALARHGIDPQKVSVTVAPGKVTYVRLLSTVLSKAQLKGELRMDEANHPLYWVTTVKPVK